MHSLSCIRTRKLSINPLCKAYSHNYFCTSEGLQFPPKNIQQCLSLLNLCTTLKQLNKNLAYLTTSGLHKNSFVTGKLVEITAIKLEKIDYAMLIFTNSPNPNSFTWNTIIRGYSISPTPQHALVIFISMLRKGVETESFTYTFTLKACARSLALQFGRTIHGLIVKTGNEFHIFVANTAIHVYSVCGELAAARKLFEKMQDRNIVTWNAMIAGYIQNSLPDDGLRVFDQMLLSGIRPNDVTMIGVLSACTQKKDIGLGRQVHTYIYENRAEFESNVNVGTSLIDLYAKCRCMDLAKQIFDEMRNKDVGTWNALIGGYVFNNQFDEALKLFHEMWLVGLDPDEATLVSTLSACTSLGTLDVGKKIHLFAEEKHFSFNVTLGTALVDMYSKCGCIDEAKEIFDKMIRKDVMTWTSMIAGHAVHGHPKDALELFVSMRHSGQKPDAVTFVGVLCACSHAGLVDEGLHYFELMRNEYHIMPIVEHYGCMVDLLSRAARLEEAFRFICSMEIKPNPIVWRTLLSACRLHSNVELAEVAVRNLFELQSDHCGDYILLSNIYSSKGMWDEAERIRKQMEEERIKKIPGLSLIETVSKEKTDSWLESCNWANKQPV